MVAAFHSLVGGAAVATSMAAYIAHPEATDAVHLVSTYAGTFIGAVTLTGMPSLAMCASNLSPPEAGFVGSSRKSGPSTPIAGPTMLAWALDLHHAA